MRVGLDTSVVLRLLLGEPAGQAHAAFEAVLETRSGGGEVLVSDLVASETYFALQHHYGVPKGEALEQLRRMFESDQVTALGVAAEVLSTSRLATAKPGFVDRLILGEYRSSVQEMLTFEKKARKLHGSRVLSAAD